MHANSRLMSILFEKWKSVFIDKKLQMSQSFRMGHQKNINIFQLEKRPDLDMKIHRKCFLIMYLAYSMRHMNDYHRHTGLKLGKCVFYFIGSLQVLCSGLRVMKNTIGDSLKEDVLSWWEWNHTVQLQCWIVNCVCVCVFSSKFLFSSLF